MTVMCDRCSTLKDDVTEMKMVFEASARELEQNICSDCVEFMSKCRSFVYDKEEKTFTVLAEAFKDDPIMNWQIDNHCIDLGLFNRMDEKGLREVIGAINKLRLQAERDRYDALVDLNNLKETHRELIAEVNSIRRELHEAPTA